MAQLIHRGGEKEEILAGPPVPVNERYFTKHCTPKRCDLAGEQLNQAVDQCVLRHSNKICVVCIAPSHPIVTDNFIEIESVQFRNESFDVSNNKVHGKRKRGGHELSPESPICEVSCKNGTKFILRSCVEGYLIEVNERLKANADLLKTKPLSDGYIAILTPKLSAVMPGETLKS